MYSDMSMRAMARSSSNRNSASALDSSVLPTPVGPRNRNEPIGRLGSPRPARLRRTASERARTGAAPPPPLLPPPAPPEPLFHLQQLLALALEHPGDRDAGPAGDDGGDLVGGHL